MKDSIPLPELKEATNPYIDLIFQPPKKKPAVEEIQAQETEQEQLSIQEYTPDKIILTKEEIILEKTQVGGRLYECNIK